MEDHHPPVRVCDLVSVDPQPQPLHQPGLGPLQIRKSLRADHPARRTISDAQDHLAAALIRQGGAVFHQLLEVEVAFGLLELQVLVFSRRHQRLQLC